MTIKKKKKTESEDTQSCPTLASGGQRRYRLLYSKGELKQNEKTTYSLGGNICK